MLIYKKLNLLKGRYDVMQMIVPHLWFDKEAKEAALYYTNLFDNSRILYTHKIENPEPYDDAEVVVFELTGIRFGAISAGPYFKLNPASSLVVYCETDEEYDRILAGLLNGGSIGDSEDVITDRFGLTWRVELVGNHEMREKIIPWLLVSNAHLALEYYSSIFENIPDLNLILQENTTEYELTEVFSLIINCKD